MPPKANKRNSSASFSEREKSPLTNQKKSCNTNSTQKQTHRKSIYKTEYQKEIIIQKDKNGDFFYCSICPGKPELQRRNIDNHCLNSVTHKNHIGNRETDHEKLVKKIQESIQKNKKNKDPQVEKEDMNNYIEFLAFCYKENLSFMQLSQVGKQLKKMSEENKIGFLKKYNFDREEISKMTCSIGDSLQEEIKKSLEERPFSLIIDNVTVSKTSICGMQVRYLKEYEDSSGFKRNAIENKVIGLKYLEESSKAKVLLNAVKEKILDLGDSIKKNFIGITHDKASVFTGEYSGLDTLLQREKGSFLFTLKDPCHALNSALNKSLTLIPEEMKFIESICQHFSSSQREAKLFQIEKKNNLKELGIKKYIKIRWLSLGETLSRLLEIWDSILVYMKEKPYYPGVQKKNYDDWIKLLEDKGFKYKLICLNGIINKKINRSNIIWQNQALEVQNLNSEMIHCLKGIAYLFINPNSIPENISVMKEKKWDSEENLYEHFVPVEVFIKNLEREIDPNLKDLFTFEADFQKEFTEYFQKYLARLLSFMIFYLPIEDRIVKALDFLNLTQSISELKENILYFNERFSIIPPQQTPDLFEEINLLSSQDKVWMKPLCKESALHFWNLIEGTSTTSTGCPKYPLLSKVFKIAHSLPTSSACIEQSFSSLKMVKSNLRNQMNEKTVESLIFIQQAFRSEDFIITDEMIQRCEETRKSLRVRKSRSREFIVQVGEEIDLQGNNHDEDELNVCENLNDLLEEVPKEVENEQNMNESLPQFEEKKEIIEERKKDDEILEAKSEHSEPKEINREEEKLEHNSPQEFNRGEEFESNSVQEMNREEENQSLLPLNLKKK